VASCSPLFVGYLAAMGWIGRAVVATSGHLYSAPLVLVGRRGPGWDRNSVHARAPCAPRSEGWTPGAVLGGLGMMGRRR